MTEQYLLGKIEKEQYVLETGILQGHVSKLSHNLDDDTTEASTVLVSAPRISFIKEYPLLSNLALISHHVTVTLMQLSRISV